jgi:uncharacterized membrane protein YqaE (UPF0057 family)
VKKGVKMTKFGHIKNQLGKKVILTFCFTILLFLLSFFPFWSDFRALIARVVGPFAISSGSGWFSDFLIHLHVFLSNFSL